MEPATARLQVRQRRGILTGYLVRCIIEARESLGSVTREQCLGSIPSSVSDSSSTHANADYVTKQTDAQSVMSRFPAPLNSRQHIHTLLHSVPEGPMVMRTCVLDLDHDATSPRTCMR
jgi:hypothetical protein